MSAQALQHIRSNLKASAEGIRRETLDGRPHLVVPVVMIVDGVLNGALVTQEEYGRYVEAWNGRPIPVAHPVRDGVNVSANRPDVLQTDVIGQLFNAKAEGGRLMAEAWIDVQKATRLGHGALLSALERGDVVEVSTGYFSDAEDTAGEFGGLPYTCIHRNIRPDHLALLPGDIGACSVHDGCGTRNNSQERDTMSTPKIKAAAEALLVALGLKSNRCQCEETPMDLKKRAEALKANGKITPEQFDLLSKADPEQLAMIAALVQALTAAAPAPAAEPADMADKGAAPAASMKPEDVEAMVANIARRREVVQKLVANEACPYTEAEMKTMNVDHLEKLEKAVRPADYSGQGGAVHTHAADDKAQPMVLPKGVLTGANKGK